MRERADFAKLLSGSLKNGVTLAITNVPYAHYNVYVYCSANNAEDFKITDGTTSYYGATTPTLTTFTPITSTVAGTFTAGNYVQFTGETTGNLTITETNDGGQGGICGLQIFNAASSTYANNFVVTGNATLDVTNVAAAATIGSLTIGNATLSVTGGSSGPMQPTR